MKKELKIINELYYWKEKLKVPPFILDFRFMKKYAGKVYCNKKNIPILVLNIEYLKKQNSNSIIMTLIHELGHIYYKTYNFSFLSKYNNIRAEYLAEKFMLDNVKKCSPKLYNLIKKDRINQLKKTFWQKKYPIHYKAFKKLYLKK